MIKFCQNRDLNGRVELAQPPLDVIRVNGGDFTLSIISDPFSDGPQ